MTQTKPGEVYWVDLGMIEKRRPMMVVSREDPDAERAICVCVPLTTQVRGGNYEQPLPKVKWLPAGDGVANVLGIKSIPHVRLERLAGRFETAVYEAVQWRISWMVQQRDKPSK